MWRVKLEVPMHIKSKIKLIFLKSGWSVRDSAIWARGFLKYVRGVGVPWCLCPPNPMSMETQVVSMCM